jgi:hypothetical protein
VHVLEALPGSLDLTKTARTEFLGAAPHLALLLQFSRCLSVVTEHWRKMSAVAGSMGSMEAAWRVCRPQKLRERHKKYGKSRPFVHCLLRWYSRELCELAIWFVSFLSQRLAQLQLPGFRPFSLTSHWFSLVTTTTPHTYWSASRIWTPLFMPELA